MKLPSFNLWIGQTAERLGFHIQRQSKKRQITVSAIPLALALIHRKYSHPLIVQVGAFDGTFQDPLCYFLSDSIHFHKAVLVEPQQAACEKLIALHSKNHRVVIEPSAISTSEGTIEFFSPSTVEASPLASTNINELVKRGYLKKDISSVKVPCLTIPSLMQKHHLESIQLLQLDCESMDAAIITHMLRHQVFPSAIHFEITNLDTKQLSDIRSTLAANQYQFIEYDHDCLALNESLLAP